MHGWENVASRRNAKLAAGHASRWSHSPPFESGHRHSRGTLRRPGYPSRRQARACMGAPPTAVVPRPGRQWCQHACQIVPASVRRAVDPSLNSRVGFCCVALDRSGPMGMLRILRACDGQIFAGFVSSA